MIYEFADCELDTSAQELRADGELVPVEPQVFAVLEHLLANADRVVTKIELLDEVWGGRFVSEAALTSRIKLARQACGDSGRAQRIVKTVHGRGYRLVAPVVERGAAAVAAAGTLTSGPGAVGRDDEIGRLTAAADTAGAGEQVTVVVSGAAGAGKTTVVAELLERLDDSGGWLVLRGRCHRSRSGPEPYFALLDALGNLAGAEPDLVRDTLDRVAPSWLLQLPALVDDDTAARLERRLLGGARQRMLREGADALTALARDRPAVLVVEDLHLADDCTLDVLELLATRHDAVPFLVVATARPGAEPVDELLGELRAAAAVIEVPLGPLDRDAIAALLDDREPGCAVPADLVDLVHDRCDGNPLFAAEILGAWRSAGLVAEAESSLVIVADPAELKSTVPGDLVPLIGRTLDGLGPEQAAVLEAAAVAGLEFDAAVVAAGLDRSVATTEALLSEMARRPDHVTATGVTRAPDGSMATSFAFTHQLYRDVIRERMPVGRRAELHRRIGTALERAHEGADDSVVVELADHFVAAGDAARAARYLRRAAVQAINRQSPGRAGELLTEALAEVTRLDEGDERDRLEVGIRLSAGQARVATDGWFDEEAAGHYGRALVLAQRRGVADAEADARYALATISELHGDYPRTEELLTPLISVDDGDLEMEAHELVACSTFHQGAFERSEVNASAVLTSWPEDTPSEQMARVAEHPATSCNSWLSLSNWFLGRSDDSLRRAETAVRLGERHEYALATAMQQRTMLHQLRDEPEACLEWAERTCALERPLVSRVRVVQAELFAGWARAALGGTDADREAMVDAVARFREAGVRLNAPYYLALHGDALLRHGRPGEALTLLDEAEALIDETTRTYFHRSEIHRLRARVALAEGGSDARERARAALDESLRLAWDMGSPALALRTTCERFELEIELGDGDGAHEPWREPLSDLVARYDGQDPPPDVQRARALLDA